MERNISACEFVIIVCTPIYAQKANKRDGGVGYEAMIITSQLAKNILQDRFIPVLRFGEFDDSAVSIWLQSKIGVDLRGDPYDKQQYELLVQALLPGNDTTRTVPIPVRFAPTQRAILRTAESVIRRA